MSRKKPTEAISIQDQHQIEMYKFSELIATLFVKNIESESMTLNMTLKDLGNLYIELSETIIKRESAMLEDRYKHKELSKKYENPHY